MLAVSEGDVEMLALTNFSCQGQSNKLFHFQEIIQYSSTE